MKTMFSDSVELPNMMMMPLTVTEIYDQVFKILTPTVSGHGELKIPLLNLNVPPGPVTAQCGPVL
jgi:hypothetical protein